MTSIAIVTYTRANENLTKELLDITREVKRKGYSVSMEWYSEVKTTLPSDVDFYICQTVIVGTKYRKLEHLLKHKSYDYIISLDNDVEADASEFLPWIDLTIACQYDLSWGCVRSRNVNNFISKLVHVDKLLSHNILRPLLWKLKLGITIPGQCFMIKNEAFKNKMLRSDTFLDDISIGLLAVREDLSHLYVHKVLVSETPSYTFSDLLKQRARWAKGYRQMLYCERLSRKEKKLLYIHGFVYHIFPLINLALLTALFVFCPVFFISLFFVNTVLLSAEDSKMFFYAAVYQIVFPLFHINWLKEFIKGYTCN